MYVSFPLIMDVHNILALISSWKGGLLINKCVLLLQIASEGLKHRVFEVSLADLQGDEENAFRKIRLRAEDVQGKNVLTNFWV